MHLLDLCRMLPFEKEICQHFDTNAIPYQFDEQAHKLISERIRISFMPSLSEPEQWHHEVLRDENLLYLWEDIYQQKKDLVLSRISALLGLNGRIHGRQTTIRRLDKADYATFLETYHLMGATQAKYRLGLFLDEELVAVAGFGRECPIDHRGKSYRSSELIRFCNKSGYTVVGGLSKLINHFVDQQKIEHLMTYVDREWSDGRIYEKLGFELIGQTPPQYFYLSPVDGKRYLERHLKTAGTNYANWPKLTNLGNNKYIKIFV